MGPLWRRRSHARAPPPRGTVEEQRPHVHAAARRARQSRHGNVAHASLVSLWHLLFFFSFFFLSLRPCLRFWSSWRRPTFPCLALHAAWAPWHCPLPPLVSLPFIYYRFYF